MRAARWAVVVTALAAAALAFHLLMSPASEPSPTVSEQARDTFGGPPQEDIDPESREALRDFLRDSAHEE